MATTGPDAAWVMGAGLTQTDGCAADGIDVDYWNGATWSLLPATTALPGQTGSNGAIAASSPRNVWVFPLLGGSGTSVYATTENWNGTSWTAVPLPLHMLVSSAVAFSASDAWVSGLTESGTSILVRFTGSSWHRASLPGEPVQVSALSASDIWAVGPSAKTAARPVTKHAIVAMHWSGRKWRTLATPRIRLPRGEGEQVIAVAAAGPDDVWWVEQPVTTKYQDRPGTRLLHWNGARWSSVAAPPGAEDLTQDGNGGVWLGAFQGPSEALVTVAYHYSAALRRTKSVLPVPTGFNSTSLGLFWIPHSRSVWAIGIAHASDNAETGLAERYTP
jgi:hypothetical protein